MGWLSGWRNRPPREDVAADERTGRILIRLDHVTTRFEQIADRIEVRLTDDESWEADNGAE